MKRLPFPSSPARFIFSSSGPRSARRPNKVSAEERAVPPISERARIGMVPEFLQFQ